MENSLNNENELRINTDTIDYREMYSMSDKLKIMISSDTDEITEKLLESLVQSYQVCEDSIKASNFVLSGDKGLF